MAVSRPGNAGPGPEAEPGPRRVRRAGRRRSRQDRARQGLHQRRQDREGARAFAPARRRARCSRTCSGRASRRRRAAPGRRDVPARRSASRSCSRSAQPAIEPQRLEENQPFSYKARVEVLPEIASVNYEGSPPSARRSRSRTSRSTRSSTKLRRAHSTLEPPSRAAPGANGRRRDHRLRGRGRRRRRSTTPARTTFRSSSARGQLLPRSTKRCQGKNVGDTGRRRGRRCPRRIPHAKLQGKKATFKLELKDLKERVLPDADDEFAKDLGEFETLDALKKTSGERLEKQAKEAARQRRRRAAGDRARQGQPDPGAAVARRAAGAHDRAGNPGRRARSQGGSVTGLGDELRGKVRRRQRDQGPRGPARWPRSPRKRASRSATRRSRRA